VEASTPAYPIRFTFEPAERIARWRPLVAWLLVIPHVIVLWAIAIAAWLCVVVGWFAILFTGKLPEGLAGIPELMLRYQLRVMTYANFMQEEYPPFTYPMEAADPGDYPRMAVDVQPSLAGRNRLTVFFRYFLVIPHIVVLYFVGIAAGVVIMIAWFVVLFTAKWPDGMRDFVIGYLRWTTRVTGYAFLLTDEYPPFTIQ
jgi:hypothetical protein